MCVSGHSSVNWLSSIFIGATKTVWKGCTQPLQIKENQSTMTYSMLLQWKITIDPQTRHVWAGWFGLYRGISKKEFVTNNSWKILQSSMAMSSAYIYLILYFQSNLFNTACRTPALWYCTEKPQHFSPSSQPSAHGGACFVRQGQSKFWTTTREFSCYKVKVAAFPGYALDGAFP